jgi:hypothetical protein
MPPLTKPLHALRIGPLKQIAIGHGIAPERLIKTP